MDQDKHYYAFISHSSKDEKIALWLCDKLNGYHIPTAVQKEYGVPKSIKPCFTFQTDLARDPVLKKSLEKELDDSQFLIVVCSPNSAKPYYVDGEVKHFVNDEVQHFIDTGRSEKIIPFIIEGTPHAINPEEECFCPALLSLKGEAELKGIKMKDLKKRLGSKMAPVVNVIASMLGVRFDVLWDKFRRKRRQKRNLFASAAVILAALALFVWDYKRPSYKYFVDYVDCWGVPEGVIELSKDQVSRRGGTYQFEYRRIPFGEPNAYSWRVAKVSHVNSALQPIEIGNTELRDRYPIQQLEYYKSIGAVQRVLYCDTKGKVLIRHEISERDGVPATIADFRNAQEQLGSGFVGAGLTSMSMGQMDAGQKKSNIVRYAYDRDVNGHIVRQSYHANNDYDLSRSAVGDDDGIFGCRYTLDSLGRRIKMEYLGLEGEKTYTKKGVAGRAWEYDLRGNLTRTTYFDLKGNPIFNDELWASCIDIFDANGNPIEEMVFGTDGEPCLCSHGYAKCAAKYDARGNQVETAFYGIEGEPCLDKGWTHKWIVKYDAWGNRVEIASYEIDGEPCLCSHGYAKCTAKYDIRGNQIEATYFGTDGEPCLCRDGYAKCTAKYDIRGNQVEATYFGTDGEPCLCRDGYAKWTAKYDARGNEVEIAFYGIDGEPCLCSQGYARFTAKYDIRGNQVEATYFGTDGDPLLSMTHMVNGTLSAIRKAKLNLSMKFTNLWEL